MGKKASIDEALLKKAFADKHQKTLRWAQVQARRRTSAWLSFLAEHAASKEGIKGEIDRTSSMSDADKARETKEKQWESLVELQAQLEKSVQSGSTDLVLALSKSVAAARTSWEKAVAHERRLSEQAGSMIPASVFSELKMRGVFPLSELIRQQKDHIGSRLESGVRVEFFRIWDEWALEEWNPKLRELSDELNALVNHV